MVVASWFLLTITHRQHHSLPCAQSCPSYVKAQSNNSGTELAHHRQARLPTQSQFQAPKDSRVLPQAIPIGPSPPAPPLCKLASCHWGRGWWPSLQTRQRPVLSRPPPRSIRPKMRWFPHRPATRGPHESPHPSAIACTETCLGLVERVACLWHEITMETRYANNHDMLDANRT